MPSSEDAPAEIQELAGRRQAARAGRDFVTADRLRDEVGAAGWVISDVAGGFTLSRAPTPGETFPTYAEVPALYSAPDLARHSICVAHHGWAEDLALLVDGVLGDGAAEVELVLGVADGAPPPTEARFNGLSRPPVIVAVEGRLGHAEALNVAARRARGQIVHFAEPSLRLTREVLDLAAEALADPAVGAAGPFGLHTDDWRDFHPAPGAEVMALEYLVSVRRADIPTIGEMDRGFRFYRNLDIDYSRQVLAAGLRLRRYEASLERGPHRLWEATPVEERDRLSRRNFNRLLDHWARPAGPGS